MVRGATARMFVRTSKAPSSPSATSGGQVAVRYTLMISFLFVYDAQTEEAVVPHSTNSSTGAKRSCHWDHIAYEVRPKRRSPGPIPSGPTFRVLNRLGGGLNLVPTAWPTSVCWHLKVRGSRIYVQNEGSSLLTSTSGGTFSSSSRRVGIPCYINQPSSLWISTFVPP